MVPPQSASAMQYSTQITNQNAISQGLLPTMVRPKSRFDSRGRFQTATVTTPVGAGGVVGITANSARVPGRDTQSAMLM
jgi:hypothetical protein